MFDTGPHSPTRKLARRDMSYFVRDPPYKHTEKPKGIHTGGPLEVKSPRVTQHATRDERIEQNIAAMQPKDTTLAGGGVLRFVSDTESKKLPQRNANHKPDNNIFGPPLAVKSPRPRVRLGVSDEELQKIWQEDERKQVAQAKMVQAPNLVQKMAASPTNPIFPNGKPRDSGHPPRRPIEVFSGTTQERNRQSHEPAGFAGMGSNCKVQPRGGVACKPAEDFIPPEFVHKPRAHGRRTRFPPDTFSFQEPQQVFE